MKKNKETNMAEEMNKDTGKDRNGLNIVNLIYKGAKY